MSKQYGVVLIGCGHIGQQHIEDIYYRDNIRMVGVVDQDPARAAQFARRYAAEAWDTDYRPFLTRRDVDIVIVASYVDSHLPITRDCLAAGKHVLCEKPIAGSLGDALEFFNLVQHSSSKVLIAHILRHNRSYQTIARLIADGAIGELKAMRMVQNHHALNWPRYKRLMEDCSPHRGLRRALSGRDAVVFRRIHPVGRRLLRQDRRRRPPGQLRRHQCPAQQRLRRIL